MLQYTQNMSDICVNRGGAVQKWIAVGARLKLLDVVMSTQSSLCFALTVHICISYTVYISYLVY